VADDTEVRGALSVAMRENRDVALTMPPLQLVAGES